MRIDGDSHLETTHGITKDMEKDARLKETDGMIVNIEIRVTHINQINRKKAGPVQILPGKPTSQEPMRKLQTVQGTTLMQVQIARSGGTDGQNLATKEDRHKDLVEHDLDRGHLRKRR